MKLFETVSLGRLTLKNRLVMTAMSTRLAGRGGQVTDNLIEYYAQRAAGGAAMITVEEASIHPHLPHVQNALGIYADSLLPGLQRLTGRLHREGALCSLQIGHYFRSAVNGYPRYVASLGGGDAGPDDRELNHQEIAYLVGLFGQAARRTKAAGFDVVEIHACHGCIVSEFLSPWWNKRTDEYGGDRAGRFRFALEILTSVRDAVGPDYPVLFRISASEFDPDGFSEDDGVALSQALEQGGVTAINLSGGLGHKNHIGISPYSVPRGILLPLGQKVKQHVSIPVIVANGLTPETAEKAIQTGQADLIGLGRPLIVDPMWPRKVEEGRPSSIRPCIRCNQGCFGGIRDPKINGLTCLYNPQAGRELMRPIVPAQKPRKVVVVGGGPAGCEAARVAALRGHQVTVLEKDDRLGGQFNLASAPPGKGDFALLPQFYTGELDRLGVEVKTGVEADLDMLKALDADVVILALGSTPVMPPLPGVELGHVTMAHAVLGGRTRLPEPGPAVVIGGGATGLETAEYLAEKGFNVTVLEMLSAMGRDIFPGLGIREGVLHRLNECRVRLLTGHRALSITPAAVIASDRPLIGGGKQIEIPASLVVLGLGTRPNETLKIPTEPTRAEWHVVGDCHCLGNCMDGIHAAFDLAAGI